MPTFGSLFAGIGGIDLGLERAGWTGRWQVEWDDYCRRVLAKHWPDVARYGDVHDVHGAMAHAGRERLQLDGGRGQAHGEGGSTEGQEDQRQRGGYTAGSRSQAPSCDGCLEPVDLIAGGFPCQPFSFAGKQQRLADDRWLWPEFERCVRELRPRYVLVENVPGLLVGGGMDAVLGGLADLGYDAEWESIPAAAVGAPHLRYRVWIVGKRMVDPDGAPGERGWLSSGVHSQHADTDQSGSLADVAYAERIGGRWGRTEPREAGSGWASGPAEGRGDVADATGGRQPRPGQPLDAVDPEAAEAWQATEPLDGRLAHQWSTEPDVGRVAHGVPARVDRLRALGNAVVPQVVEWIGRRIIEKEGLA